jgi:hypothetical protein
MCATISTSPDVESVTTAVTRPDESNFGDKTKPSSASFAEEGLSNEELSTKAKNPLRSREAQSGKVEAGLPEDYATTQKSDQR